MRVTQIKFKLACENCGEGAMEVTADMTTKFTLEFVCSLCTSTNQKSFNYSEHVTELPLMSEISRLKLFMEIFNGLSGQDKNDVAENILIRAVVGTGKFTENEAKEFRKKAMYNGQIYERREGFYASA
jgi:hypothetical protein